jgi:hypothetical protein
LRQSTVIFGTLLFAFIVYITLRGQLPAYLDLFKPGANTSSPIASSGVATSSASSGSGGGGIGGAIDKASDVVNKGKSLINQMKGLWN